MDDDEELDNIIDIYIGGALRMAKHLTDAKKKKIIADYVGCGNYSEVARKNKVSKDTVRRLCNRTDILQKAQEKKEQNTKDMLEYLDNKKQDAMEFIDMALASMMEPEKLKKSSVQALATSIGIIIDKFTPTVQTDQSLEKLDKVLEKIGGVI